MNKNHHKFPRIIHSAILLSTLINKSNYIHKKYTKVTVRHGLPIVISIWYIFGEELAQIDKKNTAHKHPKHSLCIKCRFRDGLSENSAEIPRKTVSTTLHRSLLTAAFHCHFVTAQLLWFRPWLHLRPVHAVTFKNLGRWRFPRRFIEFQRIPQNARMFNWEVKLFTWISYFAGNSVWIL